MIDPDSPDAFSLTNDIVLSSEEAEVHLAAERAAREAAIARADASRREHAEWREQVNALRAENALLKAEEKRLGKQVRRLRLMRGPTAQVDEPG